MNCVSNNYVNVRVYASFPKCLHLASPQNNERMYYLYSALSAGGFVRSAAKEISSRQGTNSWEKQKKLETRNCVFIRVIRIYFNSPFLQLF